MNYYDILQVSETASSQEIKSAYKKLARKYHPDQNPNNADAEEKMKMLNEAYSVLSKNTKKAQYDSQFIHYQESIIKKSHVYYKNEPQKESSGVKIPRYADKYEQWIILGILIPTLLVFMVLFFNVYQELSRKENETIELYDYQRFMLYSYIQNDKYIYDALLELDVESNNKLLFIRGLQKYKNAWYDSNMNADYDFELAVEKNPALKQVVLYNKARVEMERGNDQKAYYLLLELVLETNNIELKDGFYDLNQDVASSEKNIFHVEMLEIYENLCEISFMSDFPESEHEKGQTKI